VVVVGVGIRWYQVVVVVVVSNQISGLTDKTCFYHLRNSNMQVNGSLWSTLGMINHWRVSRAHVVWSCAVQ
jgi:hypothetical protein